MITVTATRNDAGQFTQMPTRHHGESLYALLDLSRELSFNAKIKALQPECVVLETNLFDVVDTMTYAGTTEDMQPIVELVTYYRRAEMEYGGLIDVIAFNTKMRNYRTDSPLFLILLGPKLRGTDLLKVALMLACGIDDENDIKMALGYSMEDIVAAKQLSDEVGKSVGEVLAST